MLWTFVKQYRFNFFLSLIVGRRGAFVMGGEKRSGGAIVSVGGWEERRSGLIQSSELEFSRSVESYDTKTTKKISTMPKSALFPHY